jgi:hypothetical protein
MSVHFTSVRLIGVYFIDVHMLDFLISPKLPSHVTQSIVYPTDKVSVYVLYNRKAARAARCPIRRAKPEAAAHRQ